MKDWSYRKVKGVTYFEESQMNPKTDAEGEGNEGEVASTEAEQK